jgi:hypothetical protein
LTTTSENHEMSRFSSLLLSIVAGSSDCTYSTRAPSPLLTSGEAGAFADSLTPGTSRAPA